MANFLDHKNAVLNLLDDSLKFAQNTDYRSSGDNIQEIKEKLLKKELVILVCGEVKRGKSSLLAAFLEEKDLFPIDVNVATNTVTIVRYGEVEKITVMFDKNGSYDSQQISRSKIAQYVSEQGNRWNEKKVSCLSIEIPNPKLKDGLVFVDTPGVGSLNLDHSEISYGYLPNADVLIFVSDALSTLTESELKFLQSASKYCKNVIYPLTKIDKISDYMDIYQENLQKIHQFTSTPLDEIKIVPVSSLAKLKYIENKSAMLLKSSKYQDLEDEIWKLLSKKRGQIVLIPPLDDLSQELSTLKNNLKIKYISLTADNTVIKDMDNRLKSMITEKQKLLEEGSEWRIELNHELSLLNAEVLRDIQKKTSEIEEIIVENANKKGAAKNLKEITNLINEILGVITLDARNYIIDKTNQLVIGTEEKLGLVISVNEDVTEDVYFEPGQVPVRVPQESKGEKAFKVGRNAAMKSGAFGTLSAVVSGITGGALGFCIAGPGGMLLGGELGAKLGLATGAAYGSGKGLYDGINEMNNPTVQQIQQAYVKYAHQKIKEIMDSVNLTIRTLSHSLINELNNMIKAQKSTLDKNIQEIQENLKLNKTEANKTANEMKPEFEALEILNTRIKQLSDLIVQDNKTSISTITSPQSPFVRNSEEKQVTSKNEQNSNKVSLDFMEI